MMRRAGGARAVAAVLLLSGGIAACAAASPGGVGTNRLRYIYPEGARQVGLTLHNRTTETWLVQAWVRGIDPATGDVRDGRAPFFLKQPLVKALPGGSYGYQIIRSQPVPVTDRESVYLLSFKLIPSEKRPAGPDNRANVVLTYNVKLFYRPAALANGKVAEAATSLRFGREGDQLRVSNPTPYWMTFYTLTVDGKPVPSEALRRMVPPKGDALYPLPAGTHGPGGTVRWQVTDENGELTKEAVSRL